MGLPTNECAKEMRHVMGYYPGVERNEILFLVAYAGRRRITCKVR